MPNPSYYFTLFKKFQVIDHVPDGSFHGSGSPSGGYDLKATAAAAAFGSTAKGSLLGATPATSPLWAVLNAKATGGPSPVIGGQTWLPMPLFVTPAWTAFQVAAPSPKLVQVFSDWITAGKVNDIPSAVIATMPPAIAGPDPGVQLFVCSVGGDNGIRPGTVPSNFWATSLIFLVDPSNGNTVNPPELSASSEYYLTAVIGNRGNAAAGQYNNPAAVEIQAAAWVMVWNSGASPAVQLPALSNLDQNSTNGVYGVYFLKQASYDVVGFRLNVQTVFDGLVKAIGDSGTDLGGLTPEQWVHAQGAHLCAKVLVRTVTESWPVLSDTPLTNRRLAQKNLAPFAVDLAVSNPDPNIIWKNFMMGDVIKFLRFDERIGVHRIMIQAKLPPEALQLYLAIPKRSFERWFRQGSIGGFKEVSEESLYGLKAPFPEHVILQLVEPENWLEVPPLGEEFLAMSLGIEYSVSRLKPGQLGEITIVQETTTPKIDEEKQCYELEQTIVGGFTVTLEAFDSREDVAKYDKSQRKSLGKSKKD